MIRSWRNAASRKVWEGASAALLADPARLAGLIGLAETDHAAA